MCDPLDYIEALDGTDPESLTRLDHLSANSDEEVRLRAVEALQLFEPRKEIFRINQQALSDVDELVRAQALENIADWRNGSSEASLRKMAESDPSPLVRSSAISTLGTIGSETTIGFIESLLDTMDELQRLSAYFALYSLGSEEYGISAISRLRNGNYQVRCAAANSMWVFRGTELEKVARKALAKALKVEKTRAAASSIKSALSEMQ